MSDRKDLDRPHYIKISDADIGGIFPSSLEYNPPARGMWNIVHTGMLVPGAHEIFACAQGCLRGVILTAAEMFELDRLSWISVSEEDMFDGTLESDIIDGVCEIIEKLGHRPPVVLLYLSCIHLFAGVDFDVIINELGSRYKDIFFVDCYMTPTMRTTVSPVMKMSAQVYGALKPLPLNEKSVAIVGNDRATDEDSELVRIIRQNGFKLYDICNCRSFDEYLQMAEAAVNISYIPTGVLAGEELSQRFGSKHLHLTVSYDFDTIEENYRTLCDTLGIELPDFTDEKAAAEKALENAKMIIGDTPVAVDYTAVTRPFELAKLLCEHGFDVRYIVADSAGAEAEAFEWLKENRPELLIYSPVNVNMLEMPDEEHEHILAVGQKAAYYFATDNFVNMIVGGGYYGFSGIKKIADLMVDAHLNKKDRAEYLKLKGMGCASCL
ncbi:nitrogenase component 1 [Ruminococcus sp. NK3A76]|uniref:nitrogenase component 1 n=1 Tax=Ruminococcus sp. NK3A76 TaxID=877411 RepID=UPI0004915D56|nr:nitrogenase component 1 [Ruminococcus sp. NK3A76]